VAASVYMQSSLPFRFFTLNFISYLHLFAEFITHTKSRPKKDYNLSWLYFLSAVSYSCVYVCVIYRVLEEEYAILRESFFRFICMDITKHTCIRS
jgi:hypothetical protein